MKITLLIAFLFHITLAQAGYPAGWWKAFPRDPNQKWEILPQDAKAGEVILSKRTELGVFSNLARTPILFEKVKYASVEAFWQMMKYPDPTDRFDMRLQWSKDYPFTREQVKNLSDFEAKDAGEAANKLMKEHSHPWITYNHKKFNYKDMAMGSEYHYGLIKKVITAKVMQNPAIKKLLIQTGDLILKPDHTQAPDSPKAYFYFDILMEIRKDLLTGKLPRK